MWSATSLIVPCGAWFAFSHAEIALVTSASVCRRPWIARNAAVRFSDQAGLCGATKSLMKFTCTTPPLAGIIRSTSSGTPRGCASMAYAFECEKITGAAVTAKASRIVSALTCDRSTNMPTRFSSFTRLFPNPVNPL